MKLRSDWNYRPPMLMLMLMFFETGILASNDGLIV